MNKRDFIKSDLMKYRFYSLRNRGLYFIFIVVIFGLCLTVFYYNSYTPKIEIRYFSNDINRDTVFALASVRYSKDLICTLIFKKTDSVWVFFEDIFLKQRNDTLFRIPHEFWIYDDIWPQYPIDSKDTILIPFAVLSTEQPFIGLPSRNNENIPAEMYRRSIYLDINRTKTDSIQARFERRFHVKRTAENAKAAFVHRYFIESGKGYTTINKDTKDYEITLLPTNNWQVLLIFDSSMVIKEIQCLFEYASKYNIILKKDREITEIESPLTIDMIRRNALNW